MPRSGADTIESPEPNPLTAWRPVAPARGIEFRRFFSRQDVDPFDEIEWESRTAVISNEKGETVFEQSDVEVPKAWSQQATNIVASKYFRGHLGASERERSVRQLVGRVVQDVVIDSVPD